MPIDIFRRSLIASIPMLAAAALAGVSGPCTEWGALDASEPRGGDRVERDSDSGSSARAVSTEFAFRFFESVAATSSDANIFVSPVSASIALGMLQSGANGQTHTELARMLGAAGSTHEEIDAANSALMRALTGRKDVELRIANSLWSREGIPFEDAYLARIRTAYGGQVAPVDLSSREAMDRINAWVARSTSSRIQRILTRPLSDDAVLLLVNAVYFKGDWRTPFDASRTRPRPFHAAAGTRQVPMMEQQASFRYHRAPGFELVRLPYKGEDVAMWVMLPDSGRSPAFLRDSLTDASWTRWTAAARQMQVMVSLPRFRADFQADLMPALKSMGVVLAFDPSGADLSRMLRRSTSGGQNAYVSDVRQRAVVEVNETGTVAAAVTSIGVVVTSAPPPPPHVLVDRPFLVVLEDARSGAVLFVGEIGEP